LLEAVVTGLHFGFGQISSQTSKFGYNGKKSARLARDAPICFLTTLELDIPMQANPTDSLIEYPSDFPIKVMGATHIDFAATIVDVVLEFDPSFHVGRMEVRPSGKGNFTGLTVTVRATSREQLDNLYRALSGHPMVKIVM